MSTKRKHKTLMLKEKLQVIELLDNGVSLGQISKKFGIGKSTVSEIKKNKEKFLAYSSYFEKGIKERRSLKLSAYPQVEAELYQWFLEEKSKGTPLNGDKIREKAKFFHSQLIKEGSFKASSGWFQKFKQRYGIRLNACGSEELFADSAAPSYDEIKTEPHASDNEDLQSEEYLKEQVHEEDDIVEDLISPLEAFAAFNTCIRWASQNNLPLHQILCLEEMQQQLTLTEGFVKVEPNE